MVAERRHFLYGPGSLVGDLDYLLERPRIFSVRCGTAARLLVVSRTAMARLSQDSPKVAPPPLTCACAHKEPCTRACCSKQAVWLSACAQLSKHVPLHLCRAVRMRQQQAHLYLCSRAPANARLSRRRSTSCRASCCERCL